MPNLKIHIDPFNGENSFFKNGIRIGKKSHSPFRNLTSVPILSWIYKLPSLAGNEMNDNYDLVVSAPEFESALIRLVMKGQPMCSSVIEEPFEVSQSVTDRIEAISVLQSKYKPSSNIQSHSNVIAEEDDGNITHIRLDKVLFEISNAKEESIEFNNNGINWHTPDKSEVSRIIHNRYVDIPSLIDAHNQLKEEREKMSDEDIIVYDSLLLTVPRIIPTVPKEIEVGTSSEIGIKVVPNGVACPKLSFSVDNPAFSISGRTISANDSGFGTISISREDDPENVLNFAVKAFIHNKVSSIRVSANSNVMESGSSQEICVDIEPANAENADKLSVISETPDILCVMDGNIVEAQKPGEGIIAVNCDECCERFHIDVLPKLENVKLDIEDNKEFRVGESAVVKLVFTPSDAFHHSISLESSDSSVISIENYLNDEFRLKARSIGNCELILKDENGAVLQRQVVRVISTLYKKKKQSYTAFIALGCLISCFIVADKSFLGADYVIGVLMLVALFLSMWSIFKEKRHYVTSILVAGVIIWALYDIINETIQESHNKTEQVEQSDSNVDNGTGN